MAGSVDKLTGVVVKLDERVTNLETGKRPAAINIAATGSGSPTAVAPPRGNRIFTAGASPAQVGEAFKIDYYKGNMLNAPAVDVAKYMGLELTAAAEKFFGARSAECWPGAVVGHYRVGVLAHRTLDGKTLYEIDPFGLELTGCPAGVRVFVDSTGKPFALSDGYLLH